MNREDLLSPISADLPCGPDLDDAGDNDYFNYTISTEGKFPERFVDLTTGNIFNRQSIKLEDERSQIQALLARSKDVRLLVLQAQIQALLGDLQGFAETVATISALLEHFWDDLHPQAPDGDLELRQVALEGLNERGKIAIPLAYAPLVVDRRAGAITLRAWQVAMRPELAHSKEEKQSLDALQKLLSDETNAAAAGASFAAATRAATSLKAIRNAFIAHEKYEFAPTFETVLLVLADMKAILSQVVPSLAPADDSAAPLPDDETSPLEAETVAEDLPAPRASAGKPAFENVKEVKVALSSLETYFTEKEPSSPALILVRQARLLLGRPLVEVIAALAPERAAGAMMRIGQGSGFSLDMGRMKELTVSPPEDDGHGSGGGLLRRITGQSVTVTRREEAVAAMMGIETFLSQREPSSPVPMLLSHARALMSQSFSAIFNELLPEEKKN